MAGRYRHLRPRLRRNCRTKTRFPTQDAAMERLAEITAHPETRVIPHRAYPCPWCAGWHLSSKEPDVHA